LHSLRCEMKPVFYVTEDDLAEAQKRAQQSFDDRFSDALVGDDELAAVLRSHLIIERALKSFVEEMLPNPKGLSIGSLKNLRYEQIVDLALAFGILPWVDSPLRRLGRIRNKLSHDINFRLTKDVVLELRGTFPSDRLEAIEKLYAPTRDMLGKEGAEHVKDLKPQLQFTVYMMGLYRDPLWFVEAVRIAKERSCLD
jgi:hypothetical protein